MKSFAHVAVGDDKPLNAKIAALYWLRETISHAYQLNDDNFKFFTENGLTLKALVECDKHIEDCLFSGNPEKALYKEDLDILIPFVTKMGKSYNAFVADFLTSSKDRDMTALDFSPKFNEVLNYLYAHGNRPTYSQELALENE